MWDIQQKTNSTYDSRLNIRAGVMFDMSLWSEECAQSISDFSINIFNAWLALLESYLKGAFHKFHTLWVWAIIWLTVHNLFLLKTIWDIIVIYPVGLCIDQQILGPSGWAWKNRSKYLLIMHRPTGYIPTIVIRNWRDKKLYLERLICKLALFNNAVVMIMIQSNQQPCPPGTNSP